MDAILLDLKIKFVINKETRTRIKKAMEKIDELNKLKELKKAALVSTNLNEFLDQLTIT